MIDQIQNTRSSACGKGARLQSANPRYQTITSPGPRSNDTVKISKQGREQLKGTTAEATVMPGEKQLDAEQKEELADLKKTDQEVKAHEQAHMAAGAGLVMGGANYQYQRGPDGKMYAVGGEVKIDTSRENDPKDTVNKMQQVKRAAMAPAQPSGQDRSVAARASQIEAEARTELLREKAEEPKQDDPTDGMPITRNPTSNQNAYIFSPNDPSIKVVA